MKPIQKALTQQVLPIRIMIIDDHAVVRAGVRMLIESKPGMEVVCEAAKASDALKARLHILPDVILLDLDLGDENGLDFMPQLLRVFSSARILILTATTTSETHLEASALGACGIVMKEEAPEMLVEAIRRIHSGEIWKGRSLINAVPHRLLQSSPVPVGINPETQKIERLTPRELEIVNLIGKGLNGMKISELLGISETTVRNHLTSILAKLEVNNKFELAVYAFKNNLTELPGR